MGLAAARVLGNRLSRRVLELSHPLTVPGALGLDAPPHVTRAYLRRPLGDVGAYRAKCELTLHFDARPWLHEIRTRTVVLAGASDPVVPLAASQRLARSLPGARFHAMAGRPPGLVCSPRGGGCARWRLAATYLTSVRRASPRLRRYSSAIRTYANVPGSSPCRKRRPDIVTGLRTRRMVPSRATRRLRSASSSAFSCRIESTGGYVHRAHDRKAETAQAMVAEAESVGVHREQAAPG